MKILEGKNVCIRYENTKAVDNVSFEIEEGDYVSILGENGSGKSTLIKGILGLEKLYSGEISYLGGLKKEEIGYLPQQTIVQKDFPASVWEVVLSGCISKSKMRPFYSKKEKKLAKEKIEKMGITNIMNNSYKELSGGQQQRVLLARALCSTTKLLILDEPIAGLDPMITNEMYEIINKINKQGVTIIMVSHDIQFTIRHSNKIIHMKNKLLFSGATNEYLNSDIGKLFVGGIGYDDRNV